MEILALTRRVRGRLVLAEHVRNRHSHFVACAGVSNHWPDFINFAVERMDAADGHGLLTGSQPRLGKNPLSDPAPQRDIMQPKPQQTRIHSEKLLFIQLGYELGALSIPLDCILVFS